MWSRPGKIDKLQAPSSGYYPQSVGSALKMKAKYRKVTATMHKIQGQSVPSLYPHSGHFCITFTESGFSDVDVIY